MIPSCRIEPLGERWTRAQLLDYLFNCLLPEYRDPPVIKSGRWAGCYVEPNGERAWYVKAVMAELEEQPTAKLLALCCSASAPRKVNRRRWWDQLDLGLKIESAAPLSRWGKWQLFRLLTQAQNRGRCSPALQAQTRSPEAFASASLPATQLLTSSSAH